MRRSRHPVHISTEHSLRTKYRAPSRLANHLTSPFDDLCIAVSNEVMSTITGSSRRRAVVQHQGIDLEQFQTESPSHHRDDARLRILSLANLRPEKNYPLLFSACARLKENGVRFHLDVVGGGIDSQVTDVHRSATQLGLDDEVSFLGFRDDVLDLMQASDVLAISSDYESGPLVAMEAAATGLPIVSTAVGVVSEMFVDGEDCLMVQPGDAAGFGDALLRMADDPELRASIGAAARQRSGRFDMRRITRELEQMYMDTLTRVR
jgi:glycosyltransferase involved in cell wall biosynthesis